jgi:hypothetical protein
MELEPTRAHGSRSNSLRPWRAARTFEELCALGARFVEGELARFPGWGAPTLDLESVPLVPVLAAANRAGWLTLCSQPGRADAARGVEQRAFVAGFASDGVERAIGRARLAQGLAARVQRRGDPALPEVALTRVEGVPRVVSGHDPFEAELACFADALAPELLEELGRRPIVTAWDDRWGRDDALWPELARRLAGPPA